MWLSRKISSILKHNSKLSTFHTIQYRHHNKKRKEYNQPEKEAQVLINFYIKQHGAHLLTLLLK